MKKALLSIVLGSLAASCVVPSMAADGRLEFDGGIGSTPFALPPANAPVGTQVVPNDVRGIPPGGRPWVIGMSSQAPSFHLATKIRLVWPFP